MRVGLGFDIHALVPGRKLILGGVRIPYSAGLRGHSDADAVNHAICDAVFGATASGDIGDHFPDTDPRYKDADSRLFARQAARTALRKGYRIRFIDVIILAERPKLSAYKEKIRESIARDFGVLKSQVGLKAKTFEGFGPIGKGRAIACQAAVTLGRARRG